MALKNESQGVFENAHLAPFYCGIGQVKSAYNLTRKLSEILSSDRPNLIINLGTGGSFKHQQKKVFEVSSFMQRNSFLSPEKTRIELATVTTLPKAVCGTGDLIESSSDILRPYDIMDMEGYALAYVCKQFQIPFISIKYISDNSDENTLNHWKSNLKDAAKTLLESYLNININQN